MFYESIAISEDGTFTGHRKLMWEFCNDGKLQMVEYMLSLPGIHDPTMDDGTTAFSMALARKDLHLIRVLLASKHHSDIDSIGLAKRAVLELNRDSSSSNSNLRRELVNDLRQHNVLHIREATQWEKLSQE